MGWIAYGITWFIGTATIGSFLLIGFPLIIGGPITGIISGFFLFLLVDQLIKDRLREAGHDLRANTTETTAEPATE